MKNSYQVIGMNGKGQTVGSCCVAEDIMDVIKMCRMEFINPYTIIQIRQEPSDVRVGIYKLDYTDSRYRGEVISYYERG